MDLKYKYISRRIICSAKKHLFYDKFMFRRNEKRLKKSTINQAELIDVMPGIRMPMFIHPDMYFKNGYCSAIFEPDTIFFVKDYLATDNIVFDVGANVGYFSMLFSRLVGKDGKVYAFEPASFPFRLLEQNRHINKLDWLEIYNLCLGEENCDIEINAGEPGLEVYNSLAPIVHSSADTCLFEKETVKMIRGDELIAEKQISHIDLMKIDVEGAELLVLKGLGDSFKSRVIDTVVVELTQEMSRQFGYSVKDVISYLENFGYDWYRLERFGKISSINGYDELVSGMYVAKRQ